MENLDTKNWRGEFMGVFLGVSRFWIHVTRHLDDIWGSPCFQPFQSQWEVPSLSAIRADSNSAGTKCGGFMMFPCTGAVGLVQWRWWSGAAAMMCLRIQSGCCVWEKPNPLMALCLHAWHILALFWDPFGMFRVLTKQDSKFGSQALLNLNPSQFCDSTSANFADLDRPREERTQNIGPTCLVFHAALFRSCT